MSPRGQLEIICRTAQGILERAHEADRDLTDDEASLFESLYGEAITIRDSPEMEQENA